MRLIVFAALILRLYSDGKKFSEFKIDSEWQTSLSRGYIQVEQLQVLWLEDCDSTCSLEDKQLVQLTSQFAGGKSAVVRIHDFVVQEFTIDIISVPQPQAPSVLDAWPSSP